MSSRRIYLDYNASAPILPMVRDAMNQAHSFANPSSVHFEGRAAGAAIEKARQQVAALVGGQAKNVIFTSGGTEAANLALTPHIHIGADKSGFARLGLCAVEHPCVLSGHRFSPEDVTVLPVDALGRLNLSALQDWLAASPAKPVLALQFANNETGIIQPVAEAAGLIHAAGGILICDAVQAVSKVALSFDCGADLLLLSAHKFGGPKGAGAVVLKSDTLHIASPLIIGGGQEKGTRAGTQNVAAIVGFGEAAAKCIVLDDIEWRLTWENIILENAPDAVIFGVNDENRLYNTICFAVPGTSAENMLIAFDLEGISLSSGSACSSGKVGTSHVLKAMGVEPSLAKAALRLSTGWSSLEEDWEPFDAALKKILRKIRMVNSR